MSKVWAPFTYSDIVSIPKVKNYQEMTFADHLTQQGLVRTAVPSNVVLGRLYQESVNKTTGFDLRIELESENVQLGDTVRFLVTYTLDKKKEFPSYFLLNAFIIDPLGIPRGAYPLSEIPNEDGEYRSMIFVERPTESHLQKALQANQLAMSFDVSDTDLLGKWTIIVFVKGSFDGSLTNRYLLDGDTKVFNVTPKSGGMFKQNIESFLTPISVFMTVFGLSKRYFDTLLIQFKTTTNIIRNNIIFITGLLLLVVLLIVRYI